MTVQVIARLVVFVGAYMLIATEKASRATVALAGGALMMVIGATDDARDLLLREPESPGTSSSCCWG